MKNRKFLLSLYIFLLGGFLIVSCKKEIATTPDTNKPSSNPTVLKYLNPHLTYGSITDIDGNKYATIQIGTQTWMAENLRTTKYNDGTPIPHITDDTQWENDRNGAYCMYDNSIVNDTIYGKLYNWYAVGIGKLCPYGWHIPTYVEWTKLENFLGGGNAGFKMKSIGNIQDGTGLWGESSVVGTNESGFIGFPGGGRYYDGRYQGIGYNGSWWSFTESLADSTGAWARDLGYNYSNVGRGDYNKPDGFSCRCVKD